MQPVAKLQDEKKGHMVSLFFVSWYDVSALLDESPLYYIMRFLSVTGFFESPPIQNLAGVFQHAGTAANHEAVVFRIGLWQADIFEQFSRCHQISQASCSAVRFTRDGWVIDQLLLHLLTEEFVLWQLSLDQILIRQLRTETDPVRQNDLVEALIHSRVLDDADKWSKAGAGADQVQIATFQQMISEESAGWFAAD